MRALGPAGPQTADRLIADRTPPCAEFETVGELAHAVRGLRATMLDAMHLDLDRRVLSAQLQRTLRQPGYAIDVVRLEIFPGVFLPVNVYLPEARGPGRIPLVVSPTGCGSATWSEHVQKRAANLALLGMAVVVAEGFCENGVRAMPVDGVQPSPHTGYGRQLIGLPGHEFGVFLQELVSTITWALETYDEIDRSRIGAAGYSYGGQMALLLAQVDRRVWSISIPATYLGSDCSDFRLNADIWIESTRKNFVWSAPPESPLLPVNSRLLMLYPRPLHTISGHEDSGALPKVIGPAMAYADRLYALGDHTERLRFRTDGGRHHYGQGRRQGTYRWLAHTLLGEPLDSRPEQTVTLREEAELAVEIGGTRTMEAELVTAVEQQLGLRFRGGKPVSDVGVRVTAALSALFPDFAPVSFAADEVWKADVDGVRVEAHRLRGPDYSFPVFVFRGPRGPEGKQLLYLPQQGTYEELGSILEQLSSYRTVVSIDYLGIGELRSDRLLLHTVARYFMHDDPSLPKMNVELLRSYLAGSEEGRIDLHARGWSASLFALFLTALEPGRIGDVRVSGVPGNELDYLRSGEKIPDLLLWAGLFANTTAAELAAVVGRHHEVTFD